jgi:hypothetical protein
VLANRPAEYGPPDTMEINVHRISLSGAVANLAALALLCMTGMAFAGPSSVFGYIGGLSSSSGLLSSGAILSVTDAFIDTLSLVSSFGSSSAIGSGLFYPIYATVTSFLSGDSSSEIVSNFALIGYVLASLVSGLSSGVSSAISIIGVPPGAFANASLFFTAAPKVPEPNSIAILVTGVAGLAALAGRRRIRRLPKRQTKE